MGIVDGTYVKVLGYLLSLVMGARHCAGSPFVNIGPLEGAKAGELGASLTRKWR